MEPPQSKEDQIMSEGSTDSKMPPSPGAPKAKRRPTRFKPGFLLCFTVALALVVIGGFLNLRTLIVEPSRLSEADKWLILGVGFVLTGISFLFSYHVWGILRSMRFAVSLIVLLTIASVAGILIKQHDFRGPDEIHPDHQAKIEPEVAQRFAQEKFKLAAIPDPQKREKATIALRNRLIREVRKKYRQKSFFDNFLYAETFFLWNLWHKGFNIFGNKMKMDPEDKALFDRKAKAFGPRAASDWWDMRKSQKNARVTEAGVDAMAKKIKAPMEKFYNFCEALDLTRVWKSNWFAMLFFLIFLVVSINTFRRPVWKWKRLGFLVSHLSIVVMLIGTTISRRTEVRGFVRLDLQSKAASPVFQQMPRDGTFPFSDGNFYRVTPFGDGMVLFARDFKADYHKKLFVTATDEEGALFKRFKLKTGKVFGFFYGEKGPAYKIRVKDFQPRVKPHWRRVADPKAPYEPGLSYGFSLQQGETRKQFASRFLKARSSKSLGIFFPLRGDELKVAFVWPQNEEERQFYLRGLAPESLGSLVLSKHPDGEGTRIPLAPHRALADLEYEGRHYQVAILDAIKDFKAESFGRMSQRARLRDAWRFPQDFDASYNMADALREGGIPNNPALFVRVDLLGAKGQVLESEYRLVFADPRSNDHGRGVPMATGGADPHANSRGAGMNPHGTPGGSRLAAIPLSFDYDYVRAPSKHTLLVVGGKGKKPVLVQIQGGRASPPKTWVPGSLLPIPLGRQDAESLKGSSFYLDRCEIFERSRQVASYEALPNDDFFHHDPAGVQLEVDGPKGKKEFTLILSTRFSEFGLAPSIPRDVQEAQYDEHLQFRFAEDRMMFPIDWRTKLEFHKVQEPLFQCGDGKFLVVPMVDDSDFQAVKAAWDKMKQKMPFFVDFPATGPAFATREKRLSRLKELKGLFTRWFSQIPSANWLSAFKGSRVMPLDAYLAMQESEPLAKRTIRVNEPLVYGSFFDSWRFTQSDAKDREPFYTGIGIQRDGGVLLVLFSMYALGIGTILMFIVLPLLKRRRRGKIGSVDEELGFETVQEA